MIIYIKIICTGNREIVISLSLKIKKIFIKILSCEKEISYKMRYIIGIR